MLVAIAWALALIPVDARHDTPGWRSPEARCVEMAAHLDVAPALRPIVVDMCRRAPTFRRQVARLARDPDLIVTVRVGDMPSGAWRADTAIQCVHGVVRSAQVRVPAGDPLLLVELIAHEFEHIVEQLDGVQLASWVGRSGVRRAREGGPNGPIETERARQIGRRVAGEYRAGAVETTTARRR